jgi:hypothetical protein
MAAIRPIDIDCGVNFTGQNVDCGRNPPLQQFLVPFINRFVNAFLRESLGKDVPPARVVKLKKGIFYLSSIPRYYDLFLQYMTQAAPVNIDVGGVPTPVFNVDYLPNAREDGGENIIQGNVDLRIVKLYVASLTYHILSMMGWLRDPIGDDAGNVLFPGSTLMGIYQLILPAVPPNIEQACVQQLGNTMQKTYFTRGFLFFSIGGEFGQRPGYITNYIANTTTQNPPIPGGHIVWNNVNLIASTQLFISTFDKLGSDTELILQSTDVIRIRSITTNQFQEWQVTQQPPIVVSDQYVQFSVAHISGTWIPQNSEECNVFLMSQNQTLPTSRDELTSEIKNFTLQIGGRKKRQNKSKWRKQKKSNKKLGFSKRRYSRRRRIR